MLVERITERLNKEYSHLKEKDINMGPLTLNVSYIPNNLFSKVTITYKKKGRLVYFPRLPIEMSEMIHSFNINYYKLSFWIKYDINYPFSNPYFFYDTFFGNEKIRHISIDTINFYNARQPHIHYAENDIIAFSSDWLENITNPNKYLHE